MQPYGYDNRGEAANEGLIAIGILVLYKTCTVPPPLFIIKGNSYDDCAKLGPSFGVGQHVKETTNRNPQRSDAVALSLHLYDRLRGIEFP